MSNHLAIATTTAVLQSMLTQAASSAVEGAEATTVRPAANEDSARVNIYLYSVSPNAAWRNASVPTRRADGSLAERPQIALDLHYLLSFHGSDAAFEPQRILGKVLSHLNAEPQLSRAKIRSYLANLPAANILGDSDLHAQPELVKLTHVPLNLEELSKLWSVFFQVPYALSVAFLATVVLIEAEVAPQASLPVRIRTLTTLPFREPVIEAVVHAADAKRGVSIGDTIHIRGRNLRGDLNQVRVGSALVEPLEVGPEVIVLPLTSPPFGANTLRAGVQAVQVVHDLLLGEPPVPHRGFESNAFALVLRPKLVTTTSPMVVTVFEVDESPSVGVPPEHRQMSLEVNPVVGPQQRVVLLLNELAAPASGSTFQAVAKARSGVQSTVAFRISPTLQGTFLVRVQVDGAESLLESDTSGRFIGPTIVVPAP